MEANFVSNGLPSIAENRHKRQPVCSRNRTQNKPNTMFVVSNPQATCAIGGVGNDTLYVTRHDGVCARYRPGAACNTTLAACLVTTKLKHAQRSGYYRCTRETHRGMCNCSPPHHRCSALALGTTPICKTKNVRPCSKLPTAPPLQKHNSLVKLWETQSWIGRVEVCSSGVESLDQVKDQDERGRCSIADRMVDGTIRVLLELDDLIRVAGAVECGMNAVYEIVDEMLVACALVCASDDVKFYVSSPSIDILLSDRAVVEHVASALAFAKDSSPDHIDMLVDRLHYATLKLLEIEGEPRNLVTPTSKRHTFR